MGAGSIQVQYRRGSLAIMQSFVGAAGEVTVDLNCKRTALHDGMTAGGWPTHRAGFTPVRDTSYSALTTDVNIVFVTLTAGRTVTLPPIQNYPEGQRLTIVDGTLTSSSNTITITTNSTAESIIGTGGSLSTSVNLSITSSASIAGKVTVVADHGGAIFVTSTGGTIIAETAFWMRY